MGKKQIHFNGFIQNSPAPHAIGLWKHDKHEGAQHGTIDYWVKLAKLFEKGKFDSLFIADVLGTYSEYGNDYKTAVQHAVQVPDHDPLLVISAMAQATAHVGFAPTVSTTYFQPYDIARKFSTLDHLTHGRIGWNVVTSYLGSEAENLGLTERMPKETRYDRADEFLDVTYKLWESSWEDDAVVKDKATNTYADPDKVHLINHKGRFFNVPGPHIVEPSPQRTPVLFQAGASDKGRNFAGKHAEAIFVVNHSLQGLANDVNDIRSRATQQGRNKEDLKVFTMIVPVIGDTVEEAEQLHQELIQHITYEGTAALLSGQTGIDFSQFDPDQYLEDIETDAIQSLLDIYAKDPTRKWTLKEAIKHHGLGIGSVRFVGTPTQIADEIEHWVEVADVDGFNIAYGTIPNSYEDFIEKVVPILQARGVYRKDYDEENTTLRENLFGKGEKYLRSTHPGSQYKPQLNEQYSYSTAEI